MENGDRLLVSINNRLGAVLAHFQTEDPGETLPPVPIEDVMEDLYQGAILDQEESEGRVRGHNQFTAMDD